MTFQDVMNFHPNNNVVYGEIKQNLNQLLPFVGAGLTAPFFGGWTAALEGLGENLASPEKREALKALLDEGKYLEAAELLAQDRGEEALCRDMGRYFSMDKVDRRKAVDPAALKKQAVYLLPPLFPCPVLTTNFDRVIERVYRREWDVPDFENISPASEQLRNWAVQRPDTPCLFHFHGAVTGDAVEEATLVFTTSQYDRHYGPDSDTRAGLRTFMDGRSLLFLGCSLEQDRTMEVIEETAKPGRTRYAIVNCPPGRQDERVRQLGERKIRAIVYPDGAYDAVRVVLEQLLHDTNYKKYEDLQHRLSALPQAEDSPFVYRSKMTELLGRTQELEDLRAFVTGSDHGFLWWAVTGAGGSGKSRLAIEFGERLADSTHWGVHVIEKEEYSNLAALAADCDRSTLLIADYVQAHTRALGRFIESESGKAHSRPLRLLLVERTGAAVSDRKADMDWLSQLFEEVDHPERVSNCCHNGGGFLTLSPLTDEALTGVLSSFARNYRDAGLSDHSLPTAQDCAALLHRLYSVDPKLHRPLYALFLTAAWMDGKDPAHWSREKVLEHVIDRECGLLDRRIREVTHDSNQNPTLWRACLTLYRLATAALGLTAEELEDLCTQNPPEQEKARKKQKSPWERLSDAAEQVHLDGPEELLERLGLVKGGVLRPMEPDLMGEYFVYQWLTGKAREVERDAFLQAVWKHPLDAAIFFDRLFADYAHLLNDSPEQWLMLAPENPVTSELTEEHWFYGVLLSNALAVCSDLNVCNQLKGWLEELYQRFPADREIAILLAKGLVNLTTKQDISGRTETVAQLEEMYRLSHGDPEFAQRLAKGLHNLCDVQDVNGKIKTLARLENLLEQYPTDREIALALADVLYNLANKQDEISVAEILDRLKALSMLHPKELDFFAYLFNLHSQFGRTQK